MYFSFIKGQLFKDSVLSLIANVVVALINIVQLSVISKNYTPLEFSSLALFYTIENFLSSFSMSGLNITLNKVTLNRQYGLINPLKKIGMRYTLIASALLGIAAYGVYLASLATYDEFIVALMVILSLIILAFDRSQPILQGMNEFNPLRLTKIFGAIVTLGLVWWGVKFYHSSIIEIVVLILVGRILQAAIANIILIYSYRETFKAEFNQVELDVSVGETKSITLLNLGQNILSSISRLYLYNLGNVGLSLFHIGTNIPFKIKDYSKMFFTIPLQGWLRKGQENYLLKMRKFFIPFFLIGLAGCSLLAYLAKYYVPLVFGEKYVEVIAITRVATFAIVPRTLLNFLELHNIIFENTRVYQRVTFGVETFQLILMMPMIFYEGALGAVIAITICSYLQLFIYMILYARKGVRYF